MIVGSSTKIFGLQYVVNTTYSGIPPHWMEGNASYVVSNTVPSAFVPEVTTGFDTWTLLPEVNYTFGGADTSSLWGGNPDGRNNNVWITADWDSITGTDSTTISVTRVRYNATTGEMTDVDIAFDAEHFSWAVNPLSGSGDMDVRNVATHEAGHFSGLGDIYNPGDPGYFPQMGSGNEEQTMYGLIRDEEISKRDLNTGDTDGIQFIYGNLPEVRVDLMVVVDGSATYTSTYNAFGQAKKSLVELLTKMRIGDKIGVVRLPSSTILPLTEISDELTRTSISNTIDGMAAGGSGEVGAGLLSAQGQLDASGEANHKWAMILLSAAEAPSTPSISAAAQTIAPLKTEVYTLGFTGSIGQDSLSYVAEQTGGNYLIATDSSEIGTKVDRIWNGLLGRQELFSDTGSTADLENVPEPGIRWQGALVDAGVSAIQPGLRWQGSDLDLTLEDPNGTFIDSAFAAADPNVEFVSGPTFEYYNILNPVPGNWDLFVFGADLPPVPEPYSVYVLAFTDLTLQVSLDKTRYDVGETIAMEATLFRGGQPQFDGHVTGGDPITDAAVQAEIWTPGSSAAQIVTLSHVGGGVYSGTFAATTVPGSYPVTVRAEKPEFLREISRAAFVSAPFSASTVVLATNSIWLRENSQILSGNVFVNDVATEPVLNSGVELSVGKSVVTPTSYALKANRILVKKKAEVASDVYFNQLTNKGTITGTEFTPLLLPLFFSLPPFASAPPGSEDIIVKTNQSQLLYAGDYGEITVRTRGQLIFEGGIYNIESIDAKNRAELIFDNATELRIQDELETKSDVYIGPGQNATIDASEIIFYVAGGDGDNNKAEGNSEAIKLGNRNSVFANFYAPNGTIRIKNRTEATGSFIGKNVQVGKRAVLSVETAFDSLNLVKPLSDLEQNRPDIGDPGNLPTTFSLSQNMPNPFNPSTEIRYQIPEAAQVSLKVYNILGQELKVLTDQFLPAGYYRVRWDGTNKAGAAVGSGVYIYRFQAGDFVQTRKMLLLR